ncbi:hypothetical protein WICPIJ_002778 [Wickerhamomyces pijperi]|uniref:Glycosyltransferase family 71 protein n=1 Tax=Wickerhamomyces pijperi TaxID=599730 RepID=A0A9P8QB30_WICPI|nr:hypothetical protein WICPIJ_002778 [Wickerhamomyces pijperi]
MNLKFNHSRQYDALLTSLFARLSLLRNRKTNRVVVIIVVAGILWLTLTRSLVSPTGSSILSTDSDLKGYKDDIGGYLESLGLSSPESLASGLNNGFNISQLTQIKKDLTDNDYIPLGYSSIMSQFQPDEPIKPPASEQELNSRCQNYFQHAMTDIATIEYTEKELELLYLDRNTYVHSLKLDRYRKLNDTMQAMRLMMDEDEFDQALGLDSGDLDRWREEWDVLQLRFNQTFHEMAEGVTSLRAFDSCYLKRDKNSQFDGCHTVEKNLFKWATGEFPIVTNWEGTILDQFSIPTGDCFTKALRDQFYKGEGLVVTLSNSTEHFLELKSLILTLRSLKTDLPLQIIHLENDLTPEKMNGIIQIARSTKFVASLPPLDISFVNVTPSISGKYLSKFDKYGMKLISLVFSTFESVVILDTDTVPFVDIRSVLLKSKEFQSLGAFFFKDRDLKDEVTLEESTMVKSLLPSLIDTQLFSTDKLTSKSYGHPLFSRGKKHYMESGMVLMDKERHFGGILAILTLQLWDPVTSISHGDKELFWLGLLVMGDEQYFMNPLSAGAIGTMQYVRNQRVNGLSVLESKPKANTDILRKICSTHPVHVSPWNSQRPLWMNSGYSHCKKQLSAQQLRDDLSLPLYRGTYPTVKELERHYTSHLHITGMLIPPSQELYQGKSWPQEGWVSGDNACDGLLYCAYEIVNNVKSDKDRTYSPVHAELLVEFDKKETDWFDSLGELWTAARDL